MSKILVTGHRGFIGHHLVPALSKCGHEVHGYDIEDGDDIRDHYRLDHLFETERFDYVIHLAARAGVRRSERFPEEYIQTNIIGTKNIVEVCERYAVKHLINFSSSSVYGGEYTAQKLDELLQSSPRSIYGMTKFMAEQIVDRAKIFTTNVRPFTVYGPEGRKDQVVIRWIEHIKAKEPVPVYADNVEDAKKMVRGYTHVHDLIRGVIAILECTFTKQRPRNLTVNLGGAEAVSLLDLLNIFGIGRQFKVIFKGRQAGDVERSVANTLLAMRYFDWEPKLDFAKELTKIIKAGLRA